MRLGVGDVARRSVLLAAVAGAALFLWPLATAAAHAVLSRADPAQGAVLAAPPQSVTLTFAEPPDPTISRIKVLDAGGRPVSGSSPAESVAGDAFSLRVTLSGELPDGVYTVNWFSVSATDGHTDAGSFQFGVRATPPSAAVTTGGGTSGWLTATAVAGRWLLYVGLALMVGGAISALLIFAGTLPPGGRVLLRVAWLMAACGIFVLIEQERAVTDSASLLPLFQTGEGALLGYQALAVLACGVAVVGVELLPRRWTLAALACLGAAAMLFHVFASHADAAAPRPLNLAAQWIHFLSVAVWIGGLAWLLLGVRSAGRDQRIGDVRRFSRLAGVALAVVVITGLVRAVVEVGSLQALTSTSYGETLIVKVTLVFALALLGALNRYRQVPALAREGGTVEPFEWTSRGELAVAAGILALTGVLCGLVPAVSGG